MTKWEIHADYGGLDTRAISYIMSDDKLTSSPATRASLLTAALATDLFKDLARNEHYRPLILERDYIRQGIEPGLGWLDDLGLMAPPLDELSQVLPRYAWLLRLNFRLARPYLSQDDEPFYIIDNPVRKDKVFKVPMIAPAGWKGSLRSAATFGLVGRLQTMMADGAMEEELFGERARLLTLFGNEKADLAAFLGEIIGRGSGQESAAARERIGERFTRYLQERGILAEKVEGRQGRLFFYPTFFDRIGLEIINPHLRDRRVGKNPIPIECVPAGSQGWFYLLYVPFDQVNRPDEQMRETLASDLLVLAAALCDLFTVYGFGAKTSSGYGVALNNLVTVKYRKKDTPPPGQILLKGTLGEPPEWRAFRELHDMPLDEFTPDQWRKLLDDEEFETYQTARAARDRYQAELAAGQIVREVESFGELVAVMTDLAGRLRSGEGGTR